MENGVHHHRRRKERNKVVWLSKSLPPRTSPRFGYRTVRLVCGRFHCDNIKRERERDVREILLGNNKERKSNGKKKSILPVVCNVPRRPRREREKRERQRYSRATKTISYIFYDVNDEEERRTAWCLLWCSLQSNARKRRLCKMRRFFEIYSLKESPKRNKPKRAKMQKSAKRVLRFPF